MPCCLRALPIDAVNDMDEQQYPTLFISQKEPLQLNDPVQEPIVTEDEAAAD